MPDGSQRPSLTNGQAREVVTKYKHLIMKFANEAARRTRLPTHDADDFFSIGAQAALKAIETFDPSREVPEIVWVTTLIRRHIEHEARLAKRQGLTWVDGMIFTVIPLDDNHEALGGCPEALTTLRSQCQWVQDKMARLLNIHEQEALMSAFEGEAGENLGERRGVSKQRIGQLKQEAIKKLSKRARLTFRAA